MADDPDILERARTNLAYLTDMMDGLEQDRKALRNERMIFDQQWNSFTTEKVESREQLEELQEQVKVLHSTKQAEGAKAAAVLARKDEEIHHLKEQLDMQDPEKHLLRQQLKAERVRVQHMSREIGLLSDQANKANTERRDIILALRAMVSRYDELAMASADLNSLLAGIVGRSAGEPGGAWGRVERVMREGWAVCSDERFAEWFRELENAGEDITSAYGDEDMTSEDV